MISYMAHEEFCSAHCSFLNPNFYPPCSGRQATVKKFCNKKPIHVNRWLCTSSRQRAYSLNMLRSILSC